MILFFMNQTNRNVLIVILFLLNIFLLHAESDFNNEFYKHLKKNNFDIERWQYLKLNKEVVVNDKEVATDFLNLILKYNDTISFLQSTNYFSDTTLLCRQFYISMLLHQQSKAKEILIKLNAILSSTSSSAINELHNLYLLKTNDSLIEQSFAQTINRINFYKRKSITKAVFYSALLPGLGKIYMNHNSEGFSSMISTIGLGLPLAELLIKSSAISVIGFTSGVLFVPFYLANLKGSYVLRGVEIKKLEFELKHEVLDFCRFKLNNM